MLLQPEAVSELATPLSRLSEDPDSVENQNLEMSEFAFYTNFVLKVKWRQQVFGEEF